ncbi:type II toxin-antitoxin system HipA family toxin [Pseudomonas brassicacearum]|uniref:type II toxin-antitoxin system HipA family toxin n=1 Tax=Pseudomonas brassicacearum TaxID=930166 RepID=UPI003CF19E0A
MPERIFVYADWNDTAPVLLGTLHSRRLAGSERMEFEYARAVLQTIHTQIAIDPRIQPYEGRQYPARNCFGCVSDSSPDRWGRLLMDRRLERDKRAGVVPQDARLFDSDYLIGVHDAYRVGGLRFKVEEEGAFLDDHAEQAAPPMARMRELEEASRRFEAGEDRGAQGQDWIRMLIAPGGSLGGARPKASVVDDDHALWIGKFPSNRDTHDVGGWEMVVNTLAQGCGLNVAEGRAQRYASDYHCFMVKRFDRTATGGRFHFASAMTLTDHQDGDGHETGASYLEIAEVLVREGAAPDVDIPELWRRIVFNMLVSNTDDHLRNHGFLLEPGRGWRLSPAYDMNPVPGDTGLRLNVSEADNAMDLDLAMSVAGYFRVSADDARQTIERFQGVVRKWPRVARYLGISSNEQERIAPAFALAR